MSSPFSYASAHVFVAGGTSGINLGIAQAFARAGARVSVLLARRRKSPTPACDWDRRWRPT